MEGTIYITGEIGCFGEYKGIQLLDIIQQVKKYPGATSFTVYINSPGGECEAGFDIYNYLKSLTLPIKMIGSGMVASIATVIFMAGDQRILRQGCEFMIHLPWGDVAGTAEEISKYADEVKAVEKRLIDFYKKAVKLNEEAIRPLLKDETFLTNEQALSMGFATEADVLIAAKAKLFINPNTNNMNISKEDKNWFEKLFGDFGNQIKNIGKIVSLKLTAADGTTMVEFPDVADDATPAVGDKGMIDGKPAEGEILMPDGTTLVFNADKSGTLEEIKPAESSNEDLETANATIKKLEGELAAAKLEATTATTGLKKLETDFEGFKKQITSKFVVDKTDNKKDKEEKPETRSLLKKKEDK